jgi:uncharacterized protein YjiS (DUF1127 family)
MSNRTMTRLGDAIRRRWTLNRDLRRLSSLDDRMLADIGLDRVDLKSAVMNGRGPI